MRINIGDLGAQVCDESGCYDDGTGAGGASGGGYWNPYAGVDTTFTGTQTQYGGNPTLMTGPSSGKDLSPVTPGGSQAGAPTNWGAVISSIFSPITKLANTRYGVPQLNPGQSITQGPGGTYQYTQNGPGVTASGASLTGTAGLSGSLPLLLGGVALVAFMMSGKR